MMLEVTWPATNLEMIDCIPMDWFHNMGTSENCFHHIRGRNRRKSVTAYCDVTVSDVDAFLDYGGKNETKNVENDIDIGISRFIFTDTKRVDVEQVLWQPKGEGQFQNVGAVASVDEDSISEIEGGARLVQHLRVERRPILAQRKKEAMNKALGFLACEACRDDLRPIYGKRTPACYEVHHEVGLAGGGERVVSLADLAVLCANCHRAIHRTDPMMTVSAFRGEIQKTSRSENSN